MKRRGRPREVEDPVRICVRLSARDYDAIDRRARLEDMSVPRYIRQELLSALLSRASVDQSHTS